MRREILILLLPVLFGCSPGGDEQTDYDAGDQDVLGDTQPDGPEEDESDADARGDASDIVDADPDGPLDVIDADSDADTTDAIVDPTPLRDDAITSSNPFVIGEAVANRDTLQIYFATQSYTPPIGSGLLIGKVIEGTESPAVIWYSFGDTAFLYSWDNYWPASTIKLTAAVGALETLGHFGLTSAAILEFTDDDGEYDGTVASLVDDAITISSNVAYNRLAEIAGFEYLNNTLLNTDDGYPGMVIQRRYTRPYPTSNLRTSPEMFYTEGILSGTIPMREGTSIFPECPDEANCITLFELLDVMRRTTLHEELPLDERFSITLEDIALLMSALSAAPSKMQAGVTAVFGSNVTIYDKTGQVYDCDRLDHGLIVDHETGERYLVAVTMPYNATSDAMLSELVQLGLEAVIADVPAHPALQTTAGIPITIQLDDNGTQAITNYRLIGISAEAPGADVVNIWVGQIPLAQLQPMTIQDRFYLEHPFSESGVHEMIVTAHCGTRICGYRRLTVLIP